MKAAQFQAVISELMAETARINALAGKFTWESFWELLGCPVTLALALIGVGTALEKLIL